MSARPQRISPLRAIHVAASWLTVLPVPTPRVQMDRRVGGAVISATPVIGVALGAVVAALGALAALTALPSALIGVLMVVVLALATRGMHLDGLADTADGLGCYGPPERVAEVMRSGTVGPFGVAAIVAVVAVDGLGFGALVESGRWYEIGLAVVVGRVATVIAARRAIPPAHPDGFGALVAGTQRTAVAIWAVVAAGAAIATGFLGSTNGFDAVRGFTCLAAVLVVFGVVWLLTTHCARRIGGLTGDVLGAVVEISTALAIVGFASA